MLICKENTTILGYIIAKPATYGARTLWIRESTYLRYTEKSDHDPSSHPDCAKELKRRMKLHTLDLLDSSGRDPLLNTVYATYLLLVYSLKPRALDVEPLHEAALHLSECRSLAGTSVAVSRGAVSRDGKCASGYCDDRFSRSLSNFWKCVMSFEAAFVSLFHQAVGSLILPP